jgi:DNA-binding NarL/FixJ family response regulator
MIDILLVDDYPAVRAGLKMRLSLEPDLLVVGEAPDGLHAIQLARDLTPHLIIMDADMPLMNGITTAERLKAESVPSEIIILTADDSLHLQEKAKAAGVAAVFSKNGHADQLIAAIRAIVACQSPHMALV